MGYSNDCLPNQLTWHFEKMVLKNIFICGESFNQQTPVPFISMKKIFCPANCNAAPRNQITSMLDIVHGDPAKSATQ